MSAPSVLERCRMALAEIGANEKDVYLMNGALCTSPWMPDVTRWMMWSTAAWPRLVACLPCFSAAHDAQRCETEVAAKHTAMNAIIDACRADRPFQRSSCGADL